VAGFDIRNLMKDIEEAPGKVWFWDLEQAVIDADRCVQCGVCVAACPTDSIGIGDDNLPKLVKMCTGCSLCWDFCPRGAAFGTRRRGKSLARTVRSKASVMYTRATPLV
jgi:coenzyme F420 hydrogenase subunit beta